MNLKRSLPLYRGLGYDSQEENHRPGWMKDPHPGLVFDKYVDTWKLQHGEFREQKPVASNRASDKAKAGGKHAFLSEVAGRGCRACEKLVERYHDRRSEMLSAVGGEQREFTTEWRFVTGLGSSHPYETGFTWHRTLGVPFLTGSSVKGMIRAWAEVWNPETWDEARHLFGDSDELGAGRLIVFDAIPARVPGLEVDVMNPHYGEYYADASKPPADYLSPKPVFFLTVAPGTPFRFAMAHRYPSAENSRGEIEAAWDMLSSALRWLGAGAKTAVGYGRMKSDMTNVSSDQDISHLVKDLSTEQIVQMLGRDRNKTREKFGDRWELLLAAIRKEYPELRDGWKQSHKANERRAWKILYGSEGKQE